jgi:hypothetical protein
MRTFKIICRYVAVSAYLCAPAVVVALLLAARPVSF